MGKPDSADKLPGVNGAKPPEKQRPAVTPPVAGQEQAPARPPVSAHAPGTPKMTATRSRQLPTWLPNAARYLWCYVAWIALSIFCLWLLIELRVGLLSLVTYVRLRVIGVGTGETVSTSGQLRVADQWIVLALALLWLGMVVWLEAYLRTGVQSGTLWSRLVRVTIWLVVLLGAAYGLEALFTRI